MKNKKLSNKKKFAIDTVKLILKDAGITESEYMELAGITGDYDETLWTGKDVISYLKISKPRLLKLVKTGKIIRITFSERCQRYRREDILSYCEQHRETKPILNSGNKTIKK